MNNSLLQTQTKRIEFIDLAKGVCILLVVFSHCHINVPYLHYIRMPLYFILSGLFFKQYAGGVDFTIRKINKIFTPFLFFYLCSFGIYALIQYFAPDIRINSAVDDFFIDDPIYSRLCINNPLWFLLSLFTVNLMFYALFWITKNKWWQAVFIILIAICSYLVDTNKVGLPLYLAKSLYYMPFFFIGYCFKQTSLLIENSANERRDALIRLAALLIFILLATVPLNIDIHRFRFYVTAVAGVTALLLILKKIKRLPFISYCGKYSIVILCTSYWIYSPLAYILQRLFESYIGEWYKVLVFILTVAIEYFVIKLCIKFLPYVTAQKDLIPVTKSSN